MPFSTGFKAALTPDTDGCKFEAAYSRIQVDATCIRATRIRCKRGIRQHVTPSLFRQHWQPVGSCFRFKLRCIMRLYFLRKPSSLSACSLLVPAACTLVFHQHHQLRVQKVLYCHGYARRLVANCQRSPTKARFPLAELTGRVDSPSTRLVETRARQHGPC